MFAYRKRKTKHGDHGVPMAESRMCDEGEARQEDADEESSSRLSGERDNPPAAPGFFEAPFCVDDDWTGNWVGSLLYGRNAGAPERSGHNGAAKSDNCASCAARSQAEDAEAVEEVRGIANRKVEKMAPDLELVRTVDSDVSGKAIDADNMQSVVRHEQSMVARGSATKEINNEKTTVEKSLHDKIYHMEERIRLLERGGDAEMIPQKEDIYSLFQVTPWCSGASIFSIAIFFFQLLILSLCLVDLSADGSPANPFSIPPGVGMQVTIAQLLAIIITLAFNVDFVTSLAELVDGYDPVFQDNVSAHATKAKWALSNGSRFVQGALGIVVSFILVVQSDIVIELFFNFAALSFINEIDNIAFWLISGGYIFRTLRKETELVTDINIPRRIGQRKIAAFFVPLAFVPVLCGWVYVVSEQVQGKYLAQSVAVQFGAPHSPQLEFFSGVYDLVRNKRIGGRAVYLERNFRNAMFAYCRDEESWTFTYNLNAGGDIENLDACDWKARTEETNVYGLLSTSNWASLDFVSGSAVPFPFFSLISNDCSLHEDVCGQYGTCVNGDCVCDNGRYGRVCQYTLPCPVLVEDGRKGDFPDTAFSGNGFNIVGFEMVYLEGDEVTLKVQGLKDLLHKSVDLSTDLRAGINGWRKETVGGKNIHFLEVNERPVYVRKAPPTESRRPFHILFFFGRRWAIASSDAIRGIHDPYSLSEVASFMSSTFLAYWGDPPNFKFAFVSDPTDSRTPTDVVTPTHHRMKWYEALISAGGVVYSAEEIDVSLDCALCDGKNLCHNSGRCTNLSDWDEQKDFYLQGGNEILHSESFGIRAEKSVVNNPKRLKGFVEEHWGFCDCPSNTNGSLCEILV